MVGNSMNAQQTIVKQAGEIKRENIPFTLNEKRPDLKPLILASGVFSNSFLISLNTLVYVAGLLRGVLPIGLWSISISLSTYSKPIISLYGRGWANDL